MKYTLLLFTLVCSLSLTAQDCNKELLAKKPGTWKPGKQGSIKNVSAADLEKEKLVINAIHKMVNSHYNPTGCQVSFSTVFGKEPNAGMIWIADPYHYNMYILRFICDKKSADKSKYYVDYSTPTTVDISANVIFSLNNLYAADLPADDPRGYLKLKQRPQKKEGYWFMGEEVVGDYGTTSEIKEYRWLVTYNDTLPFYFVSRKEYLLIQKKRLERSMKENPGDNGYSAKFMNNINDYLKKTESELGQPAVCKWNEEERFENFVPEGSPGSFIAVKPNLSYYRKNLPRAVPQFFTVVYTLSAGDEVFAENIANIKKAVDMAVLKNMLGK
jgi:hypothetical protein